jgi:sugar lactone lactonase YvrE
VFRQRGSKYEYLDIWADKLNWAGHIAVTGDYVYVTEPGEHRIQIYSSGTHVQSIYNPMFECPYGLAILDGEIYVSDWATSRITVLTLEGAELRCWGEKGSGKTQLAYPQQIAVANDRVYVADSDNNRIQVYDLRGHHVASWQLHRAPSALCIFNDELIVSGKQDLGILHLDLKNDSGVLLEAWRPLPGSARLGGINSLAVTSDGLCVTNCAEGTLKIYPFI